MRGVHRLLPRSELPCPSPLDGHGLCVRELRARDTGVTSIAGTQPIQQHPRRPGTSPSRGVSIEASGYRAVLAALSVCPRRWQSTSASTPRRCDGCSRRLTSPRPWSSAVADAVCPAPATGADPRHISARCSARQEPEGREGRFVRLDVTDAAALRTVIADAEPDVLINAGGIPAGRS
jgi:hypothetical protein